LPKEARPGKASGREIQWKENLEKKGKAARGVLAERRESSPPWSGSKGATASEGGDFKENGGKKKKKKKKKKNGAKTVRKGKTMNLPLKREAHKPPNRKRGSVFGKLETRGG